MEEIYDGDIYTLTDETGKESEFELIGSCEFEGKTYLALVPVEEDSEEYVILRLELDETGEETSTTMTSLTASPTISRMSCSTPSITTKTATPTKTERIERAHLHILKADFPA